MSKMSSCAIKVKREESCFLCVSFFSIATSKKTFLHELRRNALLKTSIFRSKWILIGAEFNLGMWSTH